MKAFIILTVVGLIACAFATPTEMSEEQKNKAKAHFEACVKQENLSEEDANRLRQKEFSNVSAGMKCFGACLFEKVGALKDNKIQEDVVLEKLSAIIGEDKTKEILHKCKDIQGADRCDTGFKMYECLQHHKA